MGQNKRLFLPKRQLDRIGEQLAGRDPKKGEAAQAKWAPSPVPGKTPAPSAKPSIQPTAAKAMAELGAKGIIASCPERIKHKNIIFIGSECSYDDFWWKMMFMAPGYSAAGGGAGLPPASR